MELKNNVFSSMTELEIKGCYQVLPKIVRDDRGMFVKTFHAQAFNDMGFKSHFREEFFSISKKNVVRGLHFQEPPFAHDKVICCVKGAVYDVLLDLRKGSPTYSQAISVNLSESQINILYIPKGIAHGFASLADDTLIIYKTNIEYSPEYDKGILWNSVDISWPTDDPIISPRDSSFQPLKNYETPFNYEE